jgi:sRNA-binding protein
MRRRGLPIVWIGLITILIAFVVWHGWQTNIAPHIAEQRAQRQQSEPQATVPAPSEEEIKAQLQRNQAAISTQPEPKATTQNEQKPATPPKIPQPDPKRDVMEYWWETAPPKTKK